MERVEAGASVQFATIIRILRALHLLDGLDQMLPNPSPRPMELLKHKGKIRQRASSVSSTNKLPDAWTWGDEA